MLDAVGHTSLNHGLSSPALTLLPQLETIAIMPIKDVQVEELSPGNAPSIVLLHAAGTSGWMWRALAQDLAREFHVLIPDLPGHGRSSQLPWQSIGRTADLVRALIEERGHGGTAHVIGLSLGGYVGLELTAASTKVSSLLISGVNVLPFPHPLMMRTIGRLIEPVMQSNAFIRFNARQLRVPAAQLTGFREAAKAADRASLRMINLEALHFTLPERAASTATPILAVAGGNEHVLILRSLAEIRASFPRAVVGVVPDAHHGWNGEQPELFSRVVREWVGSRQLPAGLTPPETE